MDRAGPGLWLTGGAWTFGHELKTTRLTNGFLVLHVNYINEMLKPENGTNFGRHCVPRSGYNRLGLALVFRITIGNSGPFIVIWVI